MARGDINPLALFALGIGGYWLWSRSGVVAAGVPVLPTGLRTTPVPRMTPDSNRVYNQWLQTSLNRLMGCNLAVDGIIGPLTRACVKRFQEMWGLNSDGVVGAETDYYIKSALGTPGYIEVPYGQSLPASGEVWY
jgi:peptidoglycan hydrolase-like protein with peptidoglycan-binding domain